MDRHRCINVLVVISLLAILGCASQMLSSRVGNRSTLNTPISLQETRANIPILKRQAAPLYFLNHQIGWVLRGNTLYGTIDGGKTWTALNYRETQNFKKVIFSNEQ